jgi:quinol monooxygenase YgiN
MAVLRLTTVHPEPHHRDALLKIFNQMNDFFAKQKGFIFGATFTDHDGDAIGRIGVWESEDHADAVAQLNHTLALRSQVVEIIGHHPEEREEALYNIVSSPMPLRPINT